MINVDFLNINNASLIARLIPFWARGRKISLFIQALLSPLVSLHNNFKTWALDQYIYCHITAQALSLEWYLKYKLKSHFANENDVFLIVNGVNESLSCFSGDIWRNGLHWDNSLRWNVNNAFHWENEENDKKYNDDYLESVNKTNVYAPAIIDTVNYDHDDYMRDIRNIMSKFMINFNKVVIIIANN